MISTICGSFWGNCNLLFLTNSNNIHSPSGGKVFFSITYSIQFVTLRLIEIMKWFWASQLILLSFLQNKASQVSSNDIVPPKTIWCKNFERHWEPNHKKKLRQIPLVELHREDRSNGNFFQDLKSGKHEISPANKFWQLLQISSHFCQIGSQQISQNDCMNANTRLITLYRLIFKGITINQKNFESII